MFIIERKPEINKHTDKHTDRQKDRQNKKCFATFYFCLIFKFIFKNFRIDIDKINDNIFVKWIVNQ